MNLDEIRSRLLEIKDENDVFLLSDEVNYSPTGQLIADLAKSIFLRYEEILIEKYPNNEVFGRVKPPQNQFYKLLRKNFDYSQLYDLIAFTILTESGDESLGIFNDLRAKYPFPEELASIWPKDRRDFDHGARNTLNKPINETYRSLDFCIMDENKNLIEIQTRPYLFQQDNLFNHKSFKKACFDNLLSKINNDVDSFAKK